MLVHAMVLVLGRQVSMRMGWPRCRRVRESQLQRKNKAKHTEKQRTKDMGAQIKRLGENFTLILNGFQVPGPPQPWIYFLALSSRKYPEFSNSFVLFKLNSRVSKPNNFKRSSPPSIVS